MSGLDYDNLGKHKEARKEGDILTKLAQVAGGEKGLFEILSDQQFEHQKLRILLSRLSVKPQYHQEFFDTVYRDYYGNAPDDLKKKIAMSHIASFASTLRTHQIKFFGEENEAENRRTLVSGAHDLSVLGVHFGNDFAVALGNYALLIDMVEQEKLKIFIQRVLGARSVNCNFVSPVAHGMVAILQWLPLHKANLFASEAFELLAEEDGRGTPGLQDVSAYILLQTDPALKRFSELAESE